MATILVVDDRAVNRQFLVTLLGYVGHRVIEAADGEAALELAWRERPDLVIADILMPRMDGYELVKRLRDDPALAAVPVIFFSATYRLTEARRIAAAIGVKNVVGKPSEPQEIFDTVAAVLGDRATPAPDASALKVAPTDRFTESFLKTVNDLATTAMRMGTLVELGIDMHMEREPAQVLDKVVRATQDIFGARYVALGLLNVDEPGFAEFRTCGLDADVAAALRDSSIRNEAVMNRVMAGEPVRLAPAGGDVRAVGLPAGHPPINSFLIVPILGRFNVFGWLYAAEKIGGGDFSDEDERIASTIAGQLAAGYESARLFDEVRRHAGELRVEIEERQRVEETLKTTQTALTQAQKMEAVGRLTGGIAHDFNNMLQVVIGNAEILVERVADPELVKAAALIRQAADRAAALTRHLLAFARKQILQPTTFDLNDAIAGMEGLLKRTLGEDIEFQFCHDGAPAFVHAALAQVDSMILNLAINARDAMRQGGRLAIETGTVVLPEGYVAPDGEPLGGTYRNLVMTDTGTGMPPEVAARAFEPFFTTKEVSKGSGLGLAMVYGFVKQSGGHVWIESAVGRGTKITVRLPAAEALAAKAAEMAPPAPTGWETILVVEDDNMVRGYVTEQLKRLGYQVIEAQDGRAALAAIEGEAAIDLMFSDVVMPGGMSGFDLAHEARRHRPSLKVLFTSGYSEVALTERGGNPGLGYGLLKKPYRRAELAQRLREVLDRRE